MLTRKKALLSVGHNTNNLLSTLSKPCCANSQYCVGDYASRLVDTVLSYKCTLMKVLLKTGTKWWSLADFDIKMFSLKVNESHINH